MQKIPDNFEQAPEWGRVHDVQKRVAAVGRSTIYEWIKNGQVRSIAVRKKGAKTGCRLIYLPSVRAFLKSQSS